MINHLQPDEAKEKYDEGVLFIDVREAYEHMQARIPNTQLIPLSAMNARWQEIPKDQPVVIYCQTGNRSAGLVMQLHQMGYDNLYNLYGGIVAWYRHQLPVEMGSREKAG